MKKARLKRLAAGWKFTAKLGEQPFLTPLMIRESIEGFFAGAIARLPDDSLVAPQLATDVEASRERWRRAAQGEAWAATQLCDYLGFKPTEFRKAYEGKSLLQKAQLGLSRSFMQRDCALFVARVADQVRVSEQIKTLASSDLGANGMQRGSDSAPSQSTDWLSQMWGKTWYQSWVRLNATLLRREQADLIRATRERMRMGASGDLGTRDSLVVPGSKWRIIADTKTNSASLHLMPLPSWTTDTDAVEQSLFLLPPDGSKSWSFRRHRSDSENGSLASR